MKNKLLNELYEVQVKLMETLVESSVPHSMENEEAEKILKAIEYINSARLLLYPYCEEEQIAYCPYCASDELRTGGLYKRLMCGDKYHLEKYHLYYCSNCCKMFDIPLVKKPLACPFCGSEKVKEGKFYKSPTIPGTEYFSYFCPDCHEMFDVPRVLKKKEK